MNFSTARLVTVVAVMVACLLDFDFFEQLLAVGLCLCLYGLHASRSVWVATGLGLVILVQPWAVILLPAFLTWQHRLVWVYLSLWTLLAKLVEKFMDTDILRETLVLKAVGECWQGWVEKFGTTGSTFLLSALGLYYLYGMILGGRLSAWGWRWSRWAVWFFPFSPVSIFSAGLFALCEGQIHKFILLGGWCSAAGFLGLEGYVFDHPVWGMALLAIMFIPEHAWAYHLFRNRGESPQKFSIVTPVLNEAENLRELALELEKESQDIREWIVVDGGSSDDSRTVVEGVQSLATQWLESSRRGRGHQIALGIHKAHENWVLILHADSRMELGFLASLRQRLVLTPGAVGGAYKMRYRDVTDLGLLQWLNDIKTRCFEVSFGDQTQFLYKPAMESIGGYPEQPLMEDVELSLRWKGHTTLFMTSQHSRTSPRRWLERGRLQNSLQVLRLLGNYLLRRAWCGATETKSLYARYYPMARPSP